MKINQKGLDLLKRFEGCKLYAYQDPVGVWTIGYGHTDPGIKKGMEITVAEANTLLYVDLAKFEQGVELLLNKEVNPNQFSALVCFAYNLGLVKLEKSTLLKKINGSIDLQSDSSRAEVSAEWVKWNMAAGKILPGLTARRKAELNLYLTKI